MKYRYAWWRLFFSHEITDTDWRLWDRSSWASRHEPGKPLRLSILEWLDELEPQSKTNFQLVAPRKIWGYVDVPYVNRTKIGLIRFRRKSDAVMFKLVWS